MSNGMSIAIALILVPIYLYAVHRLALFAGKRMPDGKLKEMLFKER